VQTPGDHRHKDKRKNIPTEELRDFIADDESAPKTMLYPRDPSFDPQLVWKAKASMDPEGYPWYSVVQGSSRCTASSPHAGLSPAMVIGRFAEMNDVGRAI